jgi:hypothetical protein
MIYGDGGVVQGPTGYQDITLGGITVKKQQIGLMEKVSWGGYNVLSGLVGLAYPALTSAFNTTVEGLDWTRGRPDSARRREYDPIVTTMHKQGLIAPFFSIAMDRNNTGWITFGGLPPVDYEPEFARAPIRMVGQTLSLSLICEILC